MEIKIQSHCIHLGYFKKPNGVRGELILSFESKYSGFLEKSRWIFVELGGRLVPFPVTSDGITIRTDTTAVIKLEWIDNLADARKLSGCQVFIDENNRLPVEKDTQPPEWVGYRVSGTKEGFIGIIKGIDDYSGNVVFTVGRDNGEIMIPFNEKLLCNIDHFTGEILLNLPDGLIE